jgi:hypothetical protein
VQRTTVIPLSQNLKTNRVCSFSHDVSVTSNANLCDEWPAVTS